MKQLLEKNFYDGFQLLEKESVPSDCLGKVRGIFQECDVVNKNRRIYTRELWEKVITDPEVQQRIKNRQMVGEADHPEGLYEDSIDRISHVVTKIWLEGQHVMGEADLLDTPMGRIVHTLLKAKVGIGISSRGGGDTYEDDRGLIVNPDTYQIRTWDFVVGQSVHNAMPKLTEQKLTKILKENTTESEENIKRLCSKIFNKSKNPNSEEHSEPLYCILCNKEYNNIEDKYCIECNTELIPILEVKKMNKYAEALEKVVSEKVELQNEVIAKSEAMTKLEEDKVKLLESSRVQIKKLDKKIKALQMEKEKVEKKYKVASNIINTLRNELREKSELEDDTLKLMIEFSKLKYNIPAEKLENITTFKELEDVVTDVTNSDVEVDTDSDIDQEATDKEDEELIAKVKEYFKLSDDDWDAITDDEKSDYIMKYKDAVIADSETQAEQENPDEYTDEEILNDKLVILAEFDTKEEALQYIEDNADENVEIMQKADGKFIVVKNYENSANEEPTDEKPTDEEPTDEEPVAESELHERFNIQRKRDTKDSSTHKVLRAMFRMS